ncbi:Epoxide hydrolase-like [Parasponia andersonii]|uniref:soluble epoxide hydrolase n=1 Tax=Parasponia andersonii TaxID=3476 RepID=A0A2P5BUC1_PARAD|nr:Epoxide hydrolase-like [Parasponia andersonii]
MEKIEHSTVPTNGINMHIASIGTGPVVLFLHGFPELWHSWRHQMLSLSSLGYRCIAPDLRGYGDTDAPPAPESYSVLHIAGDIVGLLDHLGIDQVFLVGHDWGAAMAWYFCLFRPERVKAVVNLSVSYMRRNPAMRFLDGFRAFFGDEFYMCRFQEQGEIEKDFASDDTATVLKKLYTSFGPTPLRIPKEGGFKGLNAPDTLPSWVSEEVVNYCASKFNEKGFTGGLNYYRALNLTWELLAPWTGVQINVPAKFIVGDQDFTYHLPGMKEYIEKGGFKKDVPSLEEVVVIEGVPHFINQAMPEEISAHIYGFIKKF